MTSAGEQGTLSHAPANLKSLIIIISAKAAPAPREPPPSLQ